MRDCSLLFFLRGATLTHKEEGMRVYRLAGEIWCVTLEDGSQWRVSVKDGAVKDNLARMPARIEIRKQLLAILTGAGAPAEIIAAAQPVAAAINATGPVCPDCGALLTEVSGLSHSSHTKLHVVSAGLLREEGDPRGEVFKEEVDGTYHALQCPNGHGDFEFSEGKVVRKQL